MRLVLIAGLFALTMPAISAMLQKPPLSTPDCDNPPQLRASANCSVKISDFIRDADGIIRFATKEDVRKADPCEPFYERALSEESAMQKINGHIEATVAEATIYLACREHEK